MYLMDSSNYFSAKDHKFLVFLYLHFFNVEKKTQVGFKNGEGDSTCHKNNFLN